MQEFATRKYHGVLPGLEFLSAEKKASEASSIYFSDCSPAGGTVAAFKFSEHRHVPLAARE
jgi:hypothetical protein